MDNIGTDDPSISQPLRIFKSGMVNDEDRRNKIIDNVEKKEFESQMVNLAVVYMNDGMAIELEELIGTNVKDLERISFSVNLDGQVTSNQDLIWSGLACFFFNFYRTITIKSRRRPRRGKLCYMQAKLVLVKKRCPIRNSFGYE